MSNKDTAIQAEQFNDAVAQEIFDTLAFAARDHTLPDEVYVLIAMHDGKKEQIFTTPYAMNYHDKFANPQKLRDSAMLLGTITLQEHLASTVTKHPDVGLVATDEVTTLLSQTHGLTLIDDGTGHCALLGLLSKPVDIFIARKGSRSDREDGVKMYR